MRAEKQKEIRDLDLKLRMDKVELERMKREAANGVVTSALDGTVPVSYTHLDVYKRQGYSRSHLPVCGSRATLLQCEASSSIMG